MAASLTVEGINTLPDFDSHKADLAKAYSLGRNIVERFMALQASTGHSPADSIASSDQTRHT
jgi:hypothetical protein